MPAPLKKVESDDIELNLFSPEAVTYFTTLENYGMYTKDAVSGENMGWWSDGSKEGEEPGFSRMHSVVVGQNVNLDVSEGSFAELPLTLYYSYSCDKGINFRWSSPDPLYVSGGGGRLYANEYRFGSVGKIDATSSMGGAHFYLYSYDDSDSMKITFINDISVSYTDRMGILHSFVIREGSYMIEKEFEKNENGENKTSKTKYIADLFNETYWKSLEHVKPIEGGTDVKQWGKGNSGLGSPVYSN